MAESGLESPFGKILFEALKRAAMSRGDTLANELRLPPLGALADEIARTPPEVLFAEAAMIAMQASGTTMERTARGGLTFAISKRPLEQLVFTERSKKDLALSSEVVREAVVVANKSIELVHNFSSLYNIDLFHLLGMRNLSSFVGEVFAKQLRTLQSDVFIANPNQDGYPDLCALTAEGKKYIDHNRGADGKPRPDKGLWSPYPYGGVEVKATCGNTPAASKVAKPLIGESRLPILVSAEWKAHHQETKRLLGIYWDFVDGLPTILAAFFRNDLDTSVGADNSDWGAIIRPIDGGGRTTSVSIMKKTGVKKMGAGWLVLPEQAEFAKPLQRVFGSTVPEH